jgi:hypothetical protein
MFSWDESGVLREEVHKEVPDEVVHGHPSTRDAVHEVFGPNPKCLIWPTEGNGLKERRGKQKAGSRALWWKDIGMGAGRRDCVRCTGVLDHDVIPVFVIDDKRNTFGLTRG